MLCADVSEEVNEAGRATTLVSVELHGVQSYCFPLFGFLICITRVHSHIWRRNPRSYSFL